MRGTSNDDPEFYGPAFQTDEAPVASILQCTRQLHADRGSQSSLTGVSLGLVQIWLRASRYGDRSGCFACSGRRVMYVGQRWHTGTAANTTRLEDEIRHQCGSFEELKDAGRAKKMELAEHRHN